MGPILTVAPYHVFCMECVVCTIASWRTAYAIAPSLMKLLMLILGMHDNVHQIHLHKKIESYGGIANN